LNIGLIQFRITLTRCISCGGGGGGSSSSIVLVWVNSGFIGALGAEAVHTYLAVKPHIICW
jgi:hypothetical protein